MTLISGEGRLVPGQGPVRTGVTAILTRPKGDWDFVMAATFNQNGNGDMTGVNWIAESGYLEGPILLTGTHSVGTVRDAAVKWQEARGREFEFTYPIVSETFDALSDSTGQHVKPEHVDAFRQASIENARNSVQEPGIARFDVIQQQDDSTRFILVEVYRNQEATLKHKETAHYATWRDTVADMMAERRSSVKFSTVFPGDEGW